MPIYDFIIIGLGTAGSATCMTLARRGFRVLGVDKHRPPHAMGSHHGASRSVRRAYLEGTAYVPMALKSWELWRKLERDSGRDLLVETGNLTIGPPGQPCCYRVYGQCEDLRYSARGPQRIRSTEKMAATGPARYICRRVGKSGRHRVSGIEHQDLFSRG
jgi:N-methyl-L-tryptophan oxidase